MANWAALQEQLTGKRVIKRAKHSIHFDNGDGSVTANFSGTPCHYEEGGIWKPIDTKLLLAGDGWYGSPHSDVKIRPNGQVKVTGSDYEQFTELPSAKKGVLAGDRIIRTFPGGEQHLIMTEDGFRQEIHVEKPTFPLEKFIARQTGNLPAKYTASPLTAMDAEDNVYVFTGNVKEFGAWLDGAAYPVTIDPDFTASTAGQSVNSSNTVYADARSTSSALLTYTGYIMQNFVGQSYSDPDYGCQRGFLKFDTSSIASGSTVTAVTFSAALASNYAGDAFDVQVVMQNWSGQDPITNDNRETAFDGCLAGTSAGVWINTGTSKTRRIKYTSESLNTALVTVAGTTYLSFRSSLDYAGTAPDSIDTLALFSSLETTYQKPILTITYEAGTPTGVPKHFLHYARLRSN